MNIKVKCISYRDNLRFKEWPKFMCCRPLIGDLVHSTTGEVGKIHEITHVVEGSSYCEHTPMLVITLVKQEES